MYKKKFKPVITRVKLNPEQAVLQCDCWTSGNINAATDVATASTCNLAVSKETGSYCAVLSADVSSS